MPQHKGDGRRARGRRRREEIIAATLRVVERDGVAGVTHRTVAREADVPASSAVYYFATLDDLLVAALTAASDTYMDQLRNIDGDPVEGLARIIADAGGPGRGRALAERELTLLAARRPALRPTSRRWREAVAEVAHRYTDDPSRVQQFVAIADGLCVRVLLSGDEPGSEAPSTQQITELLRRSLPRREEYEAQG